MDNHWHQFAVAHLNESIDVKKRVIEQCVDDLVKSADLISNAIRAGNKLLICGNGGSAADSQHLAAEFVSTLSMDYQRPAIAAIALTTDTSILTASANDFGFDGVFARQVEALGRPGDVLLGFSTSGNSEVVLRAVTVAKDLGMKTIGMAGRDGGKLARLVDHAIVVPSPVTQHIQESHLALYHILVAIVERTLYPK
jgi:D-sedoheptulose 7-phosphate isomerase